MAKSFHIIISDGTIAVKHTPAKLNNSGVLKREKTEEVVLDLPEWLTASNGLLDNEDGLLSWAQEHEILLPLLQNGLQKTMIDIRAKARPKVDKNDETISIIEDIDNAQERVDNFIMKVTPKPGTSKTKAAEIALRLQSNSMELALRELKIDEEIIQKALAKLS